MGKRPHRSEYILPPLVVLGSTIVQYTTFVLILSFRYVSGGFSLVGCNPCLLMCGCPIFLFLYFSRCFLIIFSLGPVQVFRKLCLIAFRRIAVVGLKSDACKYWDSSGFEVCARMFLPHFLIVVDPGELPTFLYSCFWYLWLFLLHSSGWTFLVCLVLWCIHHHIELPMILMGLSVFLVKCGSISLVLLYLVAEVSLCVCTP